MVHLFLKLGCLFYHDHVLILSLPCAVHHIKGMWHESQEDRNKVNSSYKISIYNKIYHKYEYAAHPKL